MSFTGQAAHLVGRMLANVTNGTAIVNAADPRICEEGGKGTFLPFFEEHNWPVWLRGTLYCLGLGWSFMGVAIIADIFMVAIEEITSKRKQVMIKGKAFYVKTWNDTVANLTLMALGSSAPEILLACIETLSGKFFAGDLGPSTIVGSAAFNLLVISAVCICGIPKGEVRRINDMNVFAVTCSFSIFAYVWLLIVLMVWTPNIVTLTEAILTFLMFPLVVILAWMADRGLFSNRKEGEGLGGTAEEIKDASIMASSQFPADAIAKTLKEVRAEYGEKIDDEQANKLVIFRLLGQQKKSRAEYRIEATRKMSRGKVPVKATLTGTFNDEIVANEMGRAKNLGIKVGRSSVAPSEIVEDDLESKVGIAPGQEKSGDEENASVIQFSSPMHGFLESAGTVKVAVQRIGAADQTIKVHYETRDGTASSGEDYIAANGDLIFGPGELVKDISVTLVDDNQWEPDETFDILLSLAPPDQQSTDFKGAKLGDPAVSTITIINDDDPGILFFPTHEFEVNEKDGKVTITVERKNGSDGTITCKYSTQDHADKSAVAGADYEPVQGTLVFDHAELTKTFVIPIVNDEAYEKDERFQVILTEATGGAKFDDSTDGDTEHEIAVVKIINDRELKNVIDKLSAGLNLNMDRVKLGSSNWKQQFIDALRPGGDDEDDNEDSGGGDDEPPSCSDWFFHILALPWKLFFATCPPVDFADGYLCFFWSLAYVGLTTAFIGDLASLFGCTVGLLDSVTAITFVALGTSLPDTFASMAAATGDPYADAAIGNVTGSNAVNVFLGLGTPWLMATIYWVTTPFDIESTVGMKWATKYIAFSKESWYQDVINGVVKTAPYVSPAGDLGPSVATFVILACCCVSVLLLRRKFAGGELGGPNRLRYISAGLLITFWFIYIIVSASIAYSNVVAA